MCCAHNSLDYNEIKCSETEIMFEISVRFETGNLRLHVEKIECESNEIQLLAYIKTKYKNIIIQNGLEWQLFPA